ncbi:MAG: hypothetical protein EXR92_05835 [Gemmatimonadetes bacterium]|nr:hypothetical protein [Gemmatimonadota bacterium]
MPLRHMLFRCPYCGQDPVEGRGVSARCSGCGREFEPGNGATRIAVTDLGGATEEVLSRMLSERVVGQEGGSHFEAAASMRVATREVPVRARGTLVGYRELPGPRRVGTLRMDGRRLTFLERGGRVHEWPLVDIRSLQVSASSVGISPVTGGVVSFRLHDDSPRRWDELLKEQLRAVWRDEGRGEITEFQPRIRSR